MMHPKPVRLAGAVVAAALFILAAGGAAIASNMGFKLNKPIALAGAGQIGNNWASIPYFNPYTTLGQFCIQTNLPRVFGNSAIVTTLDSDLGSFNGLACNAIGSGGPAPIPGRGLQIRVPNIAGNPTSIIIVGSHNPTLQRRFYKVRVKPGTSLISGGRSPTTRRRSPPPTFAPSLG